MSMLVELPIIEEDAAGIKFYIALSPSTPPMALHLGRYDDPHGSRLVLDDSLLRLIIRVFQSYLDSGEVQEHPSEPDPLDPI